MVCPHNIKLSLIEIKIVTIQSEFRQKSHHFLSARKILIFEPQIIMSNNSATKLLSAFKYLKEIIDPLVLSVLSNSEPHLINPPNLKTLLDSLNEVSSWEIGEWMELRDLVECNKYHTRRAAYCRVLKILSFPSISDRSLSDLIRVV